MMDLPLTTGISQRLGLTRCQICLPFSCDSWKALAVATVQGGSDQADILAHTYVILLTLTLQRWLFAKGARLYKRPQILAASLVSKVCISCRQRLKGHGLEDMVVSLQRLATGVRPPSKLIMATGAQA